MLLQPTIVTAVAHPLVANAFIKHRFNARGGRQEEILVLDAHRTPGQSPDAVQAALIADMDLILDQVHRKAIKVDSIEIRAH